MADRQMREPCDCLCHGSKGDPGDGYSYVYDDDRGIRHEDWVTCRCGCPTAARGATETPSRTQVTQ